MVFHVSNVPTHWLMFFLKLIILLIIIIINIEIGDFSCA